MLQLLHRPVCRERHSAPRNDKLPGWIARPARWNEPHRQALERRDQRGEPQIDVCDILRRIWFHLRSERQSGARTFLLYNELPSSSGWQHLKVVLSLRQGLSAEDEIDVGGQRRSVVGSKPPKLVVGNEAVGEQHSAA